MGYLRHYQMRGDPGLFSSIGKLVKGAAGLAIPMIPGLGGIVGIAGKVAGKVAGSRAGKIAGKVVGKVGPGGVVAAAGAVGAGMAAGALAKRMMAGGQRKYRRMNPANVHALKRSMRRVTSFAKLARSVMTFTKTHRIKKARRR